MKYHFLYLKLLISLSKFVGPLEFEITRVACSSNFRVITTNYLGVQIFRKFTVISFSLWQMVTFTAAVSFGLVQIIRTAAAYCNLLQITTTVDFLICRFL